MIDFIRPDLLFSYWIYVWFFVFYFAKGDSSVVECLRFYGNPLFVMLLAFVENVFTLGMLFLDHVRRDILTNYILMILTIKCVPIYLLRHEKMHVWRDLLVFCVIFLVYNLYLWLNGTNLYEIYKETYQSVSTGNSKTPFFWIMMQRQN